MHMASTLISATVGGAFGTGSGSAAVVSGVKYNKMEQHKPLLMGVAGAAVFAVQMMNFSIAGTGSSGHIGGGFLLATLLGPVPAYLVMSVILTVQCLLFGDGGLLALGCNIFNMGIVPCYIIYPLLKRYLVNSKTRLISTIAGGMLSMALGAMGVVAQTALSFTPGLDMHAFVINMMSIHLAIGLGEGIITAGLVYLYDKANAVSENHALIGTMSLAVLTSGFLSLFASSYPDGLEWSLIQVAGTDTLAATSKVHTICESIQTQTVLLPDYAFKAVENSISSGVAGLIGCILVFAIALAAGLILSHNTKNPLF
ncbi:energy-coupling factor ABC transporter permease [Cellulosilyticum ruminicola]|uniref:energy-coupling factor ABC transporter permease n=1 Tax=Cellulosilyticum ruminicola TaxID=425254 RepID=UPI0006CF2396|nr:energy-coupling factor ABC transporter permease [Cellulosilyticum ruminicola]